MEASTEVNTNPKAPQPAIASAHQYLSNMVSDIDSAVGQLIEKIEPVLGPNEPTPGRDTAQDRTNTSAMATSLDYEASRLRELVELVHTVINRVEL